MIFNTNLNAQRNATYEATLKNLEKAKDLLNQRFENKQISNDEYIKKSKEIEQQIQNVQKMMGNI